MLSCALVQPESADEDKFHLANMMLSNGSSLVTGPERFPGAKLEAPLATHLDVVVR